MLHYEKKKDSLIVKLSGELDHRTATEIRGELDALIGKNSIRRLVLDLNGLTFMDSSGIGLIIGRYKQMARRNGSVAVFGADARMDRLFEMAGLYQLVECLA